MVRWQKIIKMFLLCVLSKKMNLRITVIGFAMCGLCAKYFQPHSAKPVLAAVFFE